MVDLAYLNSFFELLREKHKQTKKPQAESEISDLILFEMAEQENISGYELTFDQKKRLRELRAYLQLYHLLFSDKKKASSWNLERLNSAWHKHLLENNQLEYLFDFSKYLKFAMEWIADNSPLYIQPITCECLELYYIRLFRQFKAMAEYQFIIDLAKYYPNAKVSSNQLLDTMHGIDFVLRLTETTKGKRETFLAYVHIAEQGQEQNIEQKKKGVGAYRFSDGKHFIYDKAIRPAIKDIANHKSIYFTIGKDGFSFDKSQFSSLFDTNILYSRLNDLILDHREKQTKINSKDTEKVVRKWQSVAELRNTLIN